MGVSADDLMKGRLPETVPTDTPSPKDKGKEPAPAAPSETRTYAGKYKTAEELETAYKEAERKISEQGERNRMLESVLMTGSPAQVQSPQVPWTPPAPETPPADAGQYWVSQAEAKRIAEETAAAKLREFQQQQAQTQQLSAEQTYWRDEFFRRNPDLKDDDLMVRAVTSEVMQRYSHLPQPAFRALIPSMLDEIAGKTRERVAAYVARGRTEAEKAAATKAAGQVPGQPGPMSPLEQSKVPSTDELRQEAINESYERYRKTRQAPKA